MIIKHNTGKAELCFVKVPEDAHNFKISKGYLWFDNSQFTGCCKGALPEFFGKGNWQIVGNPFELSEEQCKELFNHKDGYGLTYELPKPFHRHAYFTAKAAMAEYLNRIEIYQTNPFFNPEVTMMQGDGYVYYGASDEEFAEYAQAEERVGNWILLIKTE